jgi:hypothetical protein
MFTWLKIHPEFLSRMGDGTNPGRGKTAKGCWDGKASAKGSWRALGGVARAKHGVARAKHGVGAAEGGGLPELPQLLTFIKESSHIFRRARPRFHGVAAAPCRTRRIGGGWHTYILVVNHKRVGGGGRP